MVVQHITPELLAKYDRPGPRYTSYPTVPEWNEDFGETAYREALSVAATQVDFPLSLYVHIPFCPQKCAYCGCTSITPGDDQVVEAYISDVIDEMRLVGEMLQGRRCVAQCHWGGGTPTYLRKDQIHRLFKAIHNNFSFNDTAEIAIETNPEAVTMEQLDTLRVLGFNRISLGVQDFNQTIQQTVGRNQTLEKTASVVQYCRNLGFTGINVDLIYGLPLQTLPTWMSTIEQVLAIRPDRVAIYSYAHLPSRFPHQQQLNGLPMPDTAAKYELFAAARQWLIDAGYYSIGMDHFALPEDELAQSLANHTLHRNFMGYTVIHAPDQIGFGISAISEIADCYAQNTKHLERYGDVLHQGRLATERGLKLTRDDLIRRWIIRSLMCRFQVDVTLANQLFTIDFTAYFAKEKKVLATFQEEGMILLNDAMWEVTPHGAPFIRNICMVFDAYLKESSKTLFSRTI